MNKEYIKLQNTSADELQKLGHTLQGQSNGLTWVKLSNGELVSSLDYESILKTVKSLLSSKGLKVSNIETLKTMKEEVKWNTK